MVGLLAREIPARFKQPGQLLDWGLWRYPPGVLDYLKYPVCVLANRFVEASGFEPRVSLREIFASMRERR